MSGDIPLKPHIATSALEVTGHTPMVYLNKVTQGCCAKVGK